ncbi:YceI family protein [Streptacidiphilus pinicola]|uniref:YceI family protein n=1 Tax=Streptacidiphilus pinicola TaxID=2219663 RepID=A0A2X0K2Z5_9ACTN|nr:YceI family protein [Streptacidiphilus pinicola]RAG81939.1 YceI family protein [Streptacidiphilus pinicola]
MTRTPPPAATSTAAPVTAPVTAAAATPPATSTPPALRPGRFAIDPVASTLSFTARHLFGLGLVRGTFAIRRGSVDVAEPPAGSTAVTAATAVTAEVDAGSIDTGHTSRDAKVRSATLLDAGRHPVIGFVSERVSETELTGILTVRGVARPVRLQLTDSTVAAEGRAFHVRATTTVDRTAFGVTALRGLAGRSLGITLEITCVHASLRDGTAGWEER